jgi:uncharacterized protein
MKSKQEKRELAELYSMIPATDLPCVEGCSDCCGPVPASREELRRGPKLFDALISCSSCPYVVKNGGGCAIYDDRPFMCRLFGASEEPQMQCPHGRGASRKLSVAATRDLTRRYLRLIKKTGDPIELQGLRQLVAP